MSAFDHIFGSFHLVISAFIVVYLILGFLFILGEKYGIWKLCGDLKKDIGGELSLNVATSQCRDVDVQPTSTNVETFQHRDVAGTHLTRNFLNITKRTKMKKKNWGGGTRSKTNTTTQGD